MLGPMGMLARAAADVAAHWPVYLWAVPLLVFTWFGIGFALGGVDDGRWSAVAMVVVVAVSQGGALLIRRRVERRRARAAVEG